MAKVKELLRALSGRLTCSPLSSARLVTVAAASAAVPDVQTIVGAGIALELGQDNAPPQWVRLIPPGTFQLNDGRGPFHNPTPDQVIANTRTWLGGRDAGADYDHATEYTEKTGQAAIAAGWIKDWRVTDGAVEARVEWTALAAQRIRDREYRYVSPVFDAAKGSNQVIRLQRFALTNKPSINDLPAIAAAQQQQENDVNLAKLIASALGLADTATDAELVACVTTLRHRHDQVVAASGLQASASTETIVAALRDKPDAAKWVPASEHQRLTVDLQTVTASRDELQKKLAGDETATVIATAIKEGKLVPAQKDYWEKVCAAAGSAAPLREYLKTAMVIVKPGAEARQPGAPEATITAATLSAEQREEARRHGVTAEHYAQALNDDAAAAARITGLAGR